MAIDDPTRRDRLEKIAKVLRCSVESLILDGSTQDFGELLALWPDLTKEDRAAVVAFAKSHADRTAKADVA